MYQFSLGDMFEEGRGVKKDFIEAAKWFRSAADQGHAEAQCRLGFMHHNGQGVKQNDKEAAKWFQLAADQGHAEALYNPHQMSDAERIARHGAK